MGQDADAGGPWLDTQQEAHPDRHHPHWLHMTQEDAELQICG